VFKLASFLRLITDLCVIWERFVDAANHLSIKSLVLSKVFVPAYSKVSKKNRTATFYIKQLKSLLISALKRTKTRNLSMLTIFLEDTFNENKRNPKNSTRKIFFGAGWKVYWRRGGIGLKHGV
jgi:hypothetical protein